jgi:threonine synthase
LTFRCSACGAPVPPDAPPFTCPAARPGDDVDHVVTRHPESIPFPDPGGPSNPFLRYRELLSSRHLGRAHGIADEELDEMVRKLAAAVEGTDGRRIAVTSFSRSDALSDALGFSPAGGVWVKDETGNVGGSHKIRHLFNLMLALQVRARAGLPPAADAPLAIASCGNAAWAAAILAKACGRRLDVYVPAGADEAVQERLRKLGAAVTVCPRTEEPGDPSVRRFRAEVAAGAVPFTVQGSENGLAIEGAQTLGWEIASGMRREGRALDRVFVQVGGGGLASACVAALREAHEAGVLAAMPRIHAVQAKGGHPLERAHRRVVDEIYHRLAATRPDMATAAEVLRTRLRDESVEEVLRHAASHRSHYMWPWETPPASIATGILDDETYDWRAVVQGMLESGGWPVVVEDRMIARAQEAGGEIAPVGFTGAAGLAGLMQLMEREQVRPDETVAVLLTGMKRARGR